MAVAVKVATPAANRLGPLRLSAQPDSGAPSSCHCSPRSQYTPPVELAETPLFSLPRAAPAVPGGKSARRTLPPSAQGPRSRCCFLHRHCRHDHERQEAPYCSETRLQKSASCLSFRGGTRRADLLHIESSRKTEEQATRSHLRGARPRHEHRSSAARCTPSASPRVEQCKDSLCCIGQGGVSPRTCREPTKVFPPSRTFESVEEASRPQSAHVPYNARQRYSYGSERKNGHWCPFDELLGGVAALNDLRQAVLEKQARRLRELSAYYQKCQHLSEENNYLKCRQRALARQLKEVEEASRAQRDAELKKMSALNTHLLHDNMVLHTSLASLINGQPTVVAGLFEEDTIFWEVPNFALLLRGRTCTRVVSPWLKSEKRRNCRVRFLLYPFGTRQDRLAQATGKNSCEPPACGTQCPSLFVRMKGDVEATFYLFYGRRCTSPVTYKFSESLGGGRSFYRHDFCSSWRDDLRHLGEEPFYVGLSLLQCCQRSQYLIRHHDHHSADLNRRSLRLG